jgi:fumarylacetoacetase
VAAGRVLASWLESANRPDCDFPLLNLPFGVFEPGCIGVAIGDQVVDLHACAELGLVGREWQASALNGLLHFARALRPRLIDLLRHDTQERLPEGVLIPQSECHMRLPFTIGDYTDFYASIQHATNVGKLFRPDNPLLPNYKHVPVAYHGRASSVVISGAPVRRPQGQLGEGIFGATQRLDYEMELGIFIGSGNALGTTIPVEEAEEHIFGFCLVNDWSARDIQRWEYQPLGPFLSKSFATSISPWVIMREALLPYAVRRQNQQAVLPYLQGGDEYHITLEVYLNGELMGRSNTGGLYWTPAQMISHHASNGCNLRDGDLLASGTVSGEASDARGCLLELRPNGPFLQDGDEVMIRGYAASSGHPRIGFGECRGVVAG